METSKHPINKGSSEEMKNLKFGLELELVREAWYGFHNTNPHRYDGSRYRVVNLNSCFLRSTIESRCFQGNSGSGTIRAGKVKAIIHFVLALCARAMKEVSDG